MPTSTASVPRSATSCAASVDLPAPGAPAMPDEHPARTGRRLAHGPDPGGQPRPGRASGSPSGRCRRAGRRPGGGRSSFDRSSFDGSSFDGSPFDGTLRRLEPLLPLLRLLVGIPGLALVAGRAGLGGLRPVRARPGCGTARPAPTVSGSVRRQCRSSADLTSPRRRAAARRIPGSAPAAPCRRPPSVPGSTASSPWRNPDLLRVDLLGLGEQLLLDRRVGLELGVPLGEGLVAPGEELLLRRPEACPQRVLDIPWRAAGGLPLLHQTRGRRRPSRPSRWRPTAPRRLAISASFASFAAPRCLSSSAKCEPRCRVKVSRALANRFHSASSVLRSMPRIVPPLLDDRLQPVAGRLPLGRLGQFLGLDAERLLGLDRGGPGAPSWPGTRRRWPRRRRR